jgi:hypothetical protein
VKPKTAPKRTTPKTPLEEFNTLLKKKKKKKNKVSVSGVIDDNPIKHEKSDTESVETDTESENPDFDKVLELNKRQQEIMNIANKNIIVEEDEDRSDKMSVYSRLVIGIAMNIKDDETISSKTNKTATLSQYAMFLKNKNISTANTQSAVEVDKTEKPALSGFYADSYYMALRNKISYYPVDNYSIFAHGFNDYIYQFLYGIILELLSIVYISKYQTKSYLDLMWSTKWTVAFLQLWNQ